MENSNVPTDNDIILQDFKIKSVSLKPGPIHQEGGLVITYTIDLARCHCNTK